MKMKALGRMVLPLIVQQPAGAVQVEKIKDYSMWDKYS